MKQQIGRRYHRRGGPKESRKSCTLVSFSYTMIVMPAASRHGGRRAILLALAVSVCAYAVHAKLSLYDPPHPGAVNPAAASKLWGGAEKGKTEFRGATQVLLPT